MISSWYNKIQEIKSWIDKNIEEEVSLLEIAKFSGYSTFYLSKKFHELEGVTLKEYIMISKIQHSATQLNATDNRILDIAVSHGYSSQEAFTRAFIKVYGITPWSYRNLKNLHQMPRKANCFVLSVLQNQLEVWI